MVLDAFASSRIDPNLAETMIVPIPKVDIPQSFIDFRPISLCNVLLKTISKVIVGLIRPFLNDFIGPFHSSFIPNRGTSDNAIIAQEIVHHMHKKKKLRKVFYYLRRTLRRHVIRWIGSRYATNFL